MLQERLFYEYGVKSTPSVYVNGKYQINNSSFNSLSVEDLRDSYAITVKGLLSRGGVNMLRKHDSKINKILSCSELIFLSLVIANVFVAGFVTGVTFLLLVFFL